MPATSIAQLRAMYAAKEGNSTLGIPKSVGADFVNATKGITGLPKRAPTELTPPSNPIESPVAQLRRKLRRIP